MTEEEVVAIELIPFDGEVYNLTVQEDETYVLNQIITHNCLCYKTSVMQPEAEFTDRLRSWVGGGQDAGMDGYASFLNVPKEDIPELSFLDDAISLALEVWLFGGADQLKGRIGL